jgi:hypothetical protein
MPKRIIFNPFTSRFDYIDVGTIPEYAADPVVLNFNDTWVLATGTLLGGDAMGVLGLTYSGDLGSATYLLSYYTTENTIVRTPLT